MQEECICLKCWAPYKPRKFGSANRSCGSCGSRVVKDLHQVATMVTTIHPLLSTTPFEQTPVDEDIQNVPYKHALKIIHNLRVLASLWDPARLSAEDFLILQMRKGIPPEHGKSYLVDQQEIPAGEEPETDLGGAGKLILTKGDGTTETLAQLTAATSIPSEPLPPDVKIMKNGKELARWDDESQPAVTHALTREDEQTKNLCGVRGGKFELAYNLVTCPECIKILVKKKKIPAPVSEINVELGGDVPMMVTKAVTRPPAENAKETFKKITTGLEEDRKFIASITPKAGPVPGHAYECKECGVMNPAKKTICQGCGVAFGAKSSTRFSTKKTKADKKTKKKR